MREPTRRKILTTTTVGLGGVLAGCSGIGSNDDTEPSDHEKFSNDLPEEPVVIEARFAKSDSPEADIRAVFDVVSVPPPGEYGSVSLVLDVTGDFDIFPDWDTLHHVDGDGFKEVEQGVWRLNGQSDAPRLTVDIEISEEGWPNVNFGTEGSTVLASYDSHVRGVVEGFDAVYRLNDRLDLPFEEGEVSEAVDIALEEPAFADGYDTTRFAIFGPHERVRLSHEDYFELYVIRRAESGLFPDEYDSVAMAQLLDEARQTLRLGGTLREIYGWAIRRSHPNRSSIGLADRTRRGVGRFSAAGDLHTWFHEYLHLEQQFEDPGGDLLWFREASAEYFSKLAELYIGLREFDQFHENVSDFSFWPDSAAEIPKRIHPAAYEADTILAALDAEIRTRSGDKTLMTVFRTMNDRGGSLGYETFTDIVAEAAGERLDGWLDANVLEPANPSVPESPELFGDRERYGIPLSTDIEEGKIERQVTGGFTARSRVDKK